MCTTTPPSTTLLQHPPYADSYTHTHKTHTQNTHTQNTHTTHTHTQNTHKTHTKHTHTHTQNTHKTHTHTQNTHTKHVGISKPTRCVQQPSFIANTPPPALFWSSYWQALIKPSKRLSGKRPRLFTSCLMLCPSSPHKVHTAGQTHLHNLVIQTVATVSCGAAECWNAC